MVITSPVHSPVHGPVQILQCSMCLHVPHEQMGSSARVTHFSDFLTEGKAQCSSHIEAMQIKEYRQQLNSLLEVSRSGSLDCYM